MQNVVIAPDIYVNASVALRSPPEQVVQRLLGKGGGLKPPTTEWVLDRVAAMLANIPEFKKEAIDHQLAVIRQHVVIVDDGGKHGPADWEPALVAAAKKAGAKRVITDHPDLLAKEVADGVEFIASEAWLLEATTPPPAPGT